MTPDYVKGWMAACDAMLEELQYYPPSKVGEARFFARLVWIKSQHKGESNAVASAAHVAGFIPPVVDP